MLFLCDVDPLCVAEHHAMCPLNGIGDVGQEFIIEKYEL